MLVIVKGDAPADQSPLSDLYQTFLSLLLLLMNRVGVPVAVALPEAQPQWWVALPHPQQDELSDDHPSLSVILNSFHSQLTAIMDDIDSGLNR